MTFENIISDLKNKIYKPVYLLYGEESYFIDKITDFIANNVLNAGEKSFNQTVLYGKDANVVDVVEICRKFPMMANHQVVIVKEAQNLKKFKDLDVYVESPVKSSILVLAFKHTKSIDKRLKFYTQSKKHGVIFESKKLYERQISQWIIDHLKTKNLSIHPEAVRLLYESLGSDLSRISNSIEKVIVGLPEDVKHIESDVVASNIGVHRDFNIFELQKALGAKDSLKSFKIIDHFGKDPKNNPIALTVPLLFDYFIRIIKYHTLKDKSKNNVAAELGINPFFAKEYALAAGNYSMRKLVAIVSYIKDTDLKSKGVGGNSIPEGDLLKELIYKILY